MTYIYFDTPGHGYLKVSTRELIILGIHTNISSCSHFSTNGMFTFLEQDDDAGIFFKAKEAIGEQVLFKTITTEDEAIRDNPLYDSAWVDTYAMIINTVNRTLTPTEAQK